MAKQSQHKPLNYQIDLIEAVLLKYELDNFTIIPTKKNHLRINAIWNGKIIVLHSSCSNSPNQIKQFERDLRRNIALSNAA